MSCNMTDQSKPSFVEALGPLQVVQETPEGTQKGKPINPS